MQCQSASQSLPFFYPVFHLYSFVSFLFSVPYLFTSPPKVVSSFVSLFIRFGFDECMLWIDIDIYESKKEKNHKNRRITHIVAKMFLSLILSCDCWCSHHKPSRLADPKKPNNGYPFFFHLYAPIFFSFFSHFSFFYFCLCCSSSLNMINVCECIFSRLRILMMQCIQYDVVLRALSSIIFLPIWIWIMRPSMLPLPNSSLFLQYLMRLFLLLLQKHISLSFMPFFFAFLLFSVSLLFDSLSGWYNALALWTH